MAEMRQIEAQRIVVKVGTSSLIYPNNQLNLHAITRLALVLSDLKNQGKEVVLVSSGAVGVGMNKLGLTQRPNTIPERQALAAVGQSELMAIYGRAFGTYNQTVGQMLLTRDVVDYPQSHKNALNTFKNLMKMNVIPIVNENDSVAVEEFNHLTTFGENDVLAAIITDLIKADLLIILSDIDGFYSANPTKDKHAQLLHEVCRIDQPVLAAAGGNGTKFGTGGMITKLKAAKRIIEHKQQMVLANGSDPQIIYQILAGEQVGTLFKAQSNNQVKQLVGKQQHG
ncbi:glutamate 5-kinase [Loigolactobacillus jiayinensis]|uniref:Glutamate 5-kinase n=1 Tax=Loigolactobacillus jiayinensis TaxID=2486016 RepID=A0ABW1RI64_9LACO|nr:glutamate 5-kinase [Loigolactobacillus jiayinensis]